MKLTEKQQFVVDKMKEGWQLERSWKWIGERITFSASLNMNEDCIKVDMRTLNSLKERDIIELDKYHDIKEDTNIYKLSKVLLVYEGFVVEDKSDGLILKEKKKVKGYILLNNIFHQFKGKRIKVTIDDLSEGD